MELHAGERDWAVVWWRHRASRPEVRSDLSYARAREQRAWSNQIRAGVVVMVRMKNLAAILRES